MRTSLAKLQVAILAISLGVASGAHAQPAPDPKVEEARNHFRQGKAFLDQKLYAQAITEFEAAYLLAPVPDLQFNIGQAYRLSGDVANAIAAYQKYLDADPRGAAADEARTHIAELTKMQLDQEAAAAPTTAPTPNNTPTSPQSAKIESQTQSPAPETSLPTVDATIHREPSPPTAAIVAAQERHGLAVEAGIAVGVYSSPAMFADTPDLAAGLHASVGAYFANPDSCACALAALVLANGDMIVGTATFEAAFAGVGLRASRGASSIHIGPGIAVLTGATSTVAGFGIEAGGTIGVFGNIALSLDLDFGLTGAPTGFDGSLSVLRIGIGAAYVR